MRSAKRPALHSLSKKGGVGRKRQERKGGWVWMDYSGWRGEGFLVYPYQEGERGGRGRRSNFLATSTILHA